MKALTEEAAFELWLNEFIEVLCDSGTPRRQAERYREEFEHSAFEYFSNGVTPGEAVCRELLPDDYP